jgi:allophanate hydrolase
LGSGGRDSDSHGRQIYERASVDEAPIELNTTLGYYTNYMNLLDLAGVAIPAGFRRDGLPFGVTLVGPKGTDHALLALAGRLRRVLVTRLGAMELPMPVASEVSRPVVRTARTMPTTAYMRRPGGPPRRPGLLRVTSGGAPIDVEIWGDTTRRFWIICRRRL